MPSLNKPGGLQLVAVSKAIAGRTLLSQVSLQVQQGQILGLLGPNGAGKTSCFHIILGLLTADSGAIYLEGQPLTTLAMHERARLGLGYLPQENSTFRKLSVADNIAAILELQPLPAAEQVARLEALLTEFRLSHLRQQLALSLSGGERRRLEIARALASNPKFILLDEPFAGVDPISIQEIKQTLRYLAQQQIGIIITDHNVRDTLDLCDTACILSHGSIIASGNAATLLQDPKARAVYLGDQFTI